MLLPSKMSVGKKMPGPRKMSKKVFKQPSRMGGSVLNKYKYKKEDNFDHAHYCFVVVVKGGFVRALVEWRHFGQMGKVVMGGEEHDVMLKKLDKASDALGLSLVLLFEDCVPESFREKIEDLPIWSGRSRISPSGVRRTTRCIRRCGRPSLMRG
jgi:hypothetical protein